MEPLPEAPDDMDDPHFNNFTLAIGSETMDYHSTGTVVAAVIFLLGLSANGAFLWSILTGDKRSRLRPFLINLALADLMVCFFTIAMELGWRLTITWDAGDFACRLFSMTKTLGLYVEAFVVMMMSIDRCYVVLFPLRMSGQGRRTKVLLFAAWIAATVFSIPQAVLFHVEYHPEIPNFPQCVTLHSFPSYAAEQAYILFGILAMYVIPLLIIMSLSIILLWTIRSKTPKQQGQIEKAEEILSLAFLQNRNPPRISNQAALLKSPATLRPPFYHRFSSLRTSTSTFHLREPRVRIPTGLQLVHPDTAIRRKARARTLYLSMLIVLTFILCYTPYALTISIAFVFGSDYPDGELGELMEGLLMLTLSFSTIMNPLIYGSYLLYTRNTFGRIGKLLRRTPPDLVFLSQLNEISGPHGSHFSVVLSH